MTCNKNKNLLVVAVLLLFSSFVYIKANADSRTDYVKSAKQVTIKYKLTSRPMKCLIYKTADKKFEGKIIVDVREKHGGQCGGDPATSPRAFSIAFDEKNKKVWSDAKSMLGQLEKLGGVE